VNDLHHEETDLVDEVERKRKRNCLLFFLSLVRGEGASD
jgi:hypothetical protein